ncbi:MAG TPA: lactoylglutathione lyase [Alphaproteobacteria bacterium]|nr:lactoylglutathione lyase [Alphaproteobacteria bacterium]
MDRRLLDEDGVMQICFVTDNLERSLAWFADLTGKTPSHIGKAADPDTAKAVYRGQPASVSCRLAIFKFGNIDVEFLEPGPERSAWRDLLEEKGPGCHHIAFRTRNMTARSAYLRGKGLAELQRAEFDGGGGRYAYFDTTPELGVQLELLEWDSDREPQ